MFCRSHQKMPENCPAGSSMSETAEKIVVMMETTEITAYPYCNGLLLEDKPHNFRETQSIIWIHMVGIIYIYISSLYPHKMVIFLLKCLCSSANHQGWLVQPRPERHRHVGVPGAPLHRGGSGGGCTRKVEKFSLCHLEKWNQLGLCGVYIYI